MPMNARTAVVGSALCIAADPNRQSLEELLFSVAQSALNDAELSIDDIDGIVVAANDQMDGRAISVMAASGSVGGVDRDILSTPSRVRARLCHGRLARRVGTLSHAVDRILEHDRSPLSVRGRTAWPPTLISIVACRLTTSRRSPCRRARSQPSFPTPMRRPVCWRADAAAPPLGARALASDGRHGDAAVHSGGGRGCRQRRVRLGTCESAFYGLVAWHGMGDGARVPWRPRYVDRTRARRRGRAGLRRREDR